MSAADRRARFRDLHARDGLFVLPNAWDLGSAKLLESWGFEAIATTSAGFAWTLGKLDQQVTRDELVAHVAAMADATTLPVNVDSERCFPDEPGGVAETVARLVDAGAAGFSVEDFDPATGTVDAVDVAAARIAEAAEAARAFDPAPIVVGRAENHISGVDDIDDTIARLVAYRDAGADVAYAPGLADLGQIEAVVKAVGIPVNVLLLPAGPSIPELAEAGVRRVSTGGLLAKAAYGALAAGAEELLGPGTSGYAASAISSETLEQALGSS